MSFFTVIKAVFGCCKTFSGKYIFSGNANFRKRKMFPWCLVAFQKNFRKIFSGVWKRRRKTQIQNNTSKLRLVHSNIFTENASNQAKETKTQQKKMNQRRVTTGATSDDRTARSHRSRRSSARCDRPMSGARPTSALVNRLAVRVRRAHS